MSLIYSALKPLLFRFDAETVHDATHRLARQARLWPVQPLLKRIYSVTDPRLAVTIAGLSFHNPVGLAAGFDKQGNLISAIPALGFSHVEVGTVTPKAQPGNPRPRLFRLPQDRAIINRMGFNNGGIEPLKARLAKRNHRIIIGGNIGKNKDTGQADATSDYVTCFDALHDLVDYFTVNVSSPNTENLRALQDKEPLLELLSSLQEHNAQLVKPLPLFLKIAPDLSNEQLDDIIEVVKTTHLSGIIATNTTIDRNSLRTPATQVAAIGDGGLSGPVLQDRSTTIISYIYTHTDGQLPVIGVGGVDSAQAAYAKIRAGASVVQLYTGLVYQGPGLVKTINTGLLSLLERDGFSTIADAIGADHR